jgi:hypothetical protein
LFAIGAFVEHGYLTDSNWIYAADTGALVIALAGYALLFFVIIALRRASGASAQPSQSHASG